MKATIEKAVAFLKAGEGLDQQSVEYCAHILKELSYRQEMEPAEYTDMNGVTRKSCPRCLKETGHPEILYAGQRYCSVCGQKIKH